MHGVHSPSACRARHADSQDDSLPQTLQPALHTCSGDDEDLWEEAPKAPKKEAAAQKGKAAGVKQPKQVSFSLP